MKRLYKTFFYSLMMVLGLTTLSNDLIAQNDCDNDVIPPTAVCDAGLTASPHPIDGLTLWAQDIDQGSFDDCSQVELQLVRSENNTSEPPGTESVYFAPGEIGAFEVVMWAIDEAGNANWCFTYIVIEVHTTLAGKLYLDSNESCTLDAGESDVPYAGWDVAVTNLTTAENFSTTTNQNGSYSLELSEADFATDDDILVQLIPPSGIPSMGCNYSLTITDPIQIFNEINFPVKPISDCILTSVNVGASLIRRCFTNYFNVNYYNFSTVDADNAYVQVQLDPFLEIQDAEIPYTDLGNNQYQFNLGTLAAGHGDNFWIQAYLSCDAELGMTHCVAASIFPYTCIVAGQNWSGANLEVSGECDEAMGEARFTITNTGTGATVAPLQYTVVEDVIMYMEEAVDLGAGESQEYTFPANGATWRMEVQQAPDHPDELFVAAFLEGCGGFSTPGLVNQFALGDDKPNFDIFCLENIGSWDPNDKQGFPRGYGSANYIKANTDIEYYIRFQNTGTDTAFNIRVEDQLSDQLDWATVRPGASSHDYNHTINEDGLLTFFFDDIMLPDSNVNEPLSHGFIQFKVSQNLDLVDDTSIENTADIYFDFNEAVVTNTVLHTIGSEFVTVQTQAPQIPGVLLSVSPNPMKTVARFTLENHDLKAGHLKLIDQLGRTVHTQEMNERSLELQRNSLMAGVYYYQIFDGNALVISGKLLVQ